MDKEFFYIDRPAVPVTQQVIVDPLTFMEHSVSVDIDDIDRHVITYASEVKDSEGDVVGTVLYVPGFSVHELLLDDEDGDILDEDFDEEELDIWTDNEDSWPGETEALDEFVADMGTVDGE